MSSNINKVSESRSTSIASSPDNKEFKEVMDRVVTLDNLLDESQSEVQSLQNELHTTSKHNTELQNELQVTIKYKNELEAELEKKMQELQISTKDELEPLPKPGFLGVTLGDIQRVELELKSTRADLAKKAAEVSELKAALLISQSEVEQSRKTMSNNAEMLGRSITAGAEEAEYWEVT